MTKLFVGSLPYTTTSQQLQDMFSQFGTVSQATVINDKFTGRSKGFGFVEMLNDNEAQEAITKLNGSDVDGRNIFVSVARPREDRPQGNGGFRQDRGSRSGFDRNRGRR